MSPGDILSPSIVLGFVSLYIPGFERAPALLYFEFNFKLAIHMNDMFLNKARCYNGFNKPAAL